MGKVWRWGGPNGTSTSQGPIPVLDVFKKTVTPGKTAVIDVFENENVYNGRFPGCHGFFENVQNEKSSLVMCIQ